MTAKGELQMLFNERNPYNTARGEAGYVFWGAGFDIHSSREGCFPYLHKGETFYFDITLESILVN